MVLQVVGHIYRHQGVSVSIGLLLNVSICDVGKQRVVRTESHARCYSIFISTQGIACFVASSVAHSLFVRSLIKRKHKQIQPKQAGSCIYF